MKGVEDFLSTTHSAIIGGRELRMGQIVLICLFQAANASFYSKYMMILRSMLGGEKSTSPRFAWDSFPMRRHLQTIPHDWRKGLRVPLSLISDIVDLRENYFLADFRPWFIRIPQSRLRELI